MGNKQGVDLTPEERQKLKDEKERDKLFAQQEKEKSKKDKKDKKRKKKERKKSGELDEDGESIGGSSAWSEKSQISDKSADERSVGSAPGSWYHSASEPSSRRSSVYMQASAGPGYFQHECWYAGYEEGSDSEKSKSRSRTPSMKDIKDYTQLRAGSLERYPLGFPAPEAIEPIHRGGSLDLHSVAAMEFLKERQREQQQETSSGEESLIVASRYDETIRASREKLAPLGKERMPLTQPRASVVSSKFDGKSEVLPDGLKRVTPKEIEPMKENINVEYKRRQIESGRPLTIPLPGVLASDQESLMSVDRSSITGSVYYSADEGGSLAPSVYYSLTSGSEAGDYYQERDIVEGDRPSPPSKPEAVDREGVGLSCLAHFRAENDALLLRWDTPVTDGGSPITGYIIERSEGDSDFWVRVNLVPVKELEFAIAHLYGGRDYIFRVSAENAVGISDPSPPSEIVSVTSDQEATEPHFLRELRDVVAVENQRIEFSVDIIGEPIPDVTWYKDGCEVYDTKRYEFRHVGERYILVLLNAQIGDEGDIRVRATNRAGVASSQAVIRVEAPPQVLLPPHFEEGLIFDTDEMLLLKIPYSGRPQPTASWFKNGKPVEIDDRHSMDVSDNFATLKVAGASRSDKGIYNVRLTNSQGEASASFFVTVTDRPDPPGKPMISDLTGQNITLRWEPPNEDGGCRINNYVVEYYRLGWDVWLKATSSRITWTQLTDLIVGSEYRFRIKAENAYGISEPGLPSDPILVEEGPSGTGSFDSDTNRVPSFTKLDSSEGPSREGNDGGSFDKISSNLKRTYVDEFGKSDDSIDAVMRTHKKVHLEKAPSEESESMDVQTHDRTIIENFGIGNEPADSDVETLKRSSDTGDLGSAEGSEDVSSAATRRVFLKKLGITDESTDVEMEDDHLNSYDTRMKTMENLENKTIKPTDEKLVRKSPEKHKSVKKNQASMKLKVLLNPLVKKVRYREVMLNPLWTLKRTWVTT